MSDEKTEEPTHKKLEDAKKKGQHAKSQDLGLALTMLTMTGALAALPAWVLGRAMGLVDQGLDRIDPGDDGLLPTLWDMTGTGLVAVLPFIALSVLVGAIGQLMQIGFQVTFEPLQPNFDKLNPGSGLKKLVSMKSLIEFGKTLLKAVAVGVVAWVVLKDLVPVLLGASYASPAAIVQVAWSGLLRLLAGVTLVFIVFGPLDFALQKVMFLKDQRMSKDEVKREYREMEGDPMVKGQRRALAREFATSPPEKTVPGASVVVANPTHYAVALRYDAEQVPVPLVVAKGVDNAALRIRRIAEEHGVPVIVEPPLARSLHELAIGEVIPPSNYEAVATVLRWVEMVRAGRGVETKRPDAR